MRKPRSATVLFSLCLACQSLVFVLIIAKLNQLEKDGHSITNILRSFWDSLGSDADREEFQVAARAVLEGVQGEELDDKAIGHSLEQELEQLRRKAAEDEQLIGELRKRVLEGVDLELERERADAERRRAEGERRRADLLQNKIGTLERQYRDLHEELQQMTPLFTPLCTPSHAPAQNSQPKLSPGTGIMHTPSHAALFTSPSHGDNSCTPKKSKSGPLFCSPSSGGAGMLFSPSPMKALMQSPPMQSPPSKALMQSPPMQSPPSTNGTRHDADRAVRLNRSLSKLNEALTCLTPVHNNVATPFGRRTVPVKGSLLFGSDSSALSDASPLADEGDEGGEAFDGALARLDGLASGFDSVAQSVQRELQQLRSRLRQAEARRLPRTDEQQDGQRASRDESRVEKRHQEVQTCREPQSDNALAISPPRHSTDAANATDAAAAAAAASAEADSKLRQQLAEERSRVGNLQTELAGKAGSLAESRTLIDELEGQLQGCARQIDKLKMRLSSLRAGGDGGNPESDEDPGDDFTDEPDFMVPYRKRIASAARKKHRWEHLSEDAECARKRREHLTGQSDHVYCVSQADEVTAALTFLWHGIGASSTLGASLRSFASPQTQCASVGTGIMRGAASPFRTPGRPSQGRPLTG